MTTFLIFMKMCEMYFFEILKTRCLTKPKKRLFLKTHGGGGGREGHIYLFYGAKLSKSDKQMTNHNANQVIRLSKFITLIIILKCQKTHNYAFIIYHSDIKNIIYLNILNLPKNVQNDIPNVQNDIPNVQNDIPNVQNDIPCVQNDIPCVQNDILY